MTLRDLPNPPEKGIVILIQRSAQKNVGPRRYGEGAPVQFSEFAVFISDEPEVSDVVIQWRPDTNDMYNGIKTVPEDHRSGDALCYPLLFLHDTDGWNLYKNVCIQIMFWKDKMGELLTLKYSRFKIEAQSTESHPHTLTITGSCLAMDAPEAIICFHFSVYFKIFCWFATRRTWHAI
jgi:hypothetical protein